MGRYLIFLFDTCYPRGGANDFVGSADTREGITEIVEEAFKNSKGADIVNILDSTTFKSDSAEVGGSRSDQLLANWKENLTELLDDLKIQ